MAAINRDERYVCRLCSLDLCRKTLPQYRNTADSSQDLRFTRSIPRDSETSVSLTGLKYNLVICRPHSYRWEIPMFPCFWNLCFSRYCSYHQLAALRILTHPYIQHLSSSYREHSVMARFQAVPQWT